MENQYGIGIANRYELFYDQDDVTDFETVITKKKEKKMKEPVQQLTSPATVIQTKSVSEKENKQVKKPALENGTVQHKASQDQRRGIKEQQNNSNKDNSTAQHKDGDKSFLNNRPNFNKSGGNIENREERNNRRNKEMNGTDFEKPRNVGGNGVVQRNQNRNRNFEGRKRERDRQSGSDKTGIKAIDKRDGNGKGNWGSVKQDIDDLNKPPTDDEQKESVDENTVENSALPSTGDEPKEMTLDEWKAQRQAQMLQPQYNLRKAGEGEDNAQWENMKRLDKKNGDGELNRKDDGTASGKKDDGKKKQVLDIEFHFNDGRRGGLGRRPGAGGRGGPGGHGNGQNRRPRTNRDGGERKEESHEGGENRERRPPRRPRFENRRGDYRGHDAQHAPKVNDERDFPSLG